jgi:DNA topoisomerase-3
MALKTCDQVILAIDCDREGQLIGQEIIDYLAYRGRVKRALFTAQDPKTLRQAFAQLKPNGDLRPLYEAAVARQQADQIFNLSLTRTATKTLLGPGVRGVVGIGRVKTPTLGIVCLRELEIRNFGPKDYFEIVATGDGRRRQLFDASCPGGQPSDHGSSSGRGHRPRRGGTQGATRRIGGAPAPGIATVVRLARLQKTCGQRWGWNADKTLSVAQELSDGDGKKLITYPRAEARYLSENQIGDVPAIVGALVRLRGLPTSRSASR